jgi:eukaryotic-like serine/threonine-protein kinase
LVEGYTLLEKIAAGGMAEILTARDDATGERVVIKRILPQLSGHREFVDLFAAEARVMAALEHPNIVALKATGTQGGVTFLVLEYLDGGDLRNVLKHVHSMRGVVHLETALAIIDGVAAGLSHVHGRGFLHRDLSPQNVFLTRAGEVKLLDFGIAAARTAFRAKTPYRSPEQCRDLALDARSDLFSLGILLFELTTGRRLFVGNGDAEIVSQITSGDVPRPSELSPGYPRALEEIVLRALALHPEDRFGTAVGMRMALGNFARDQDLSPSAESIARFVADGLRK